VFEDRPELKLWRKDLIALIRQTPNLDWLLLTKRPQNILRLMREAAPRGADRELRSHLYLGTTVESQDQVRRIEYLLNCRAWARVLFLSVEPMLGPLDLFPWLHAVDGGQGFDYNAGIDWVICGGESGGGARPMSPEWVYDLRDQCEEADVPFHFKQWGEWFPREEWEHNPELCLPDDHDAYIEDRHTRVFKHGINEYFPVHRVGKKAAGRLLGGRTWDEFPKMAQRSTVTDRASRRLGSQAVESQDVLGLKLT
jgi:protein gp37